MKPITMYMMSALLLCVAAAAIADPPPSPAPAQNGQALPASGNPQSVIGNPQFSDVRCVDFTRPQVTTEGLGIDPDSTLKWNDYYKVWRFESAGDHFRVTVDAAAAGTYELVVTHATAPFPQCRGGGYSPIAVTVNGAALTTGYDPAQQHDSSHGWVTDHWALPLKQGSNAIDWTAEALCTHYWIRRIEVHLPAPAVAGDSGKAAPPAAAEPTHVVDLAQSDIRLQSVRMAPNSGLKWSPYYKTWRLERAGDSFGIELTAPKARKYELLVTDLTSASSQCPGGGYSPVAIEVNGKAIAPLHDPALAHNGDHGWAIDKWDIDLNEGNNTITWTAGALCTQYWINRVEIR